MYLKGIAALVLGCLAAGLGYVGFGDATGQPAIRLNTPWLRHGLDWAEGGLDALRVRIGGDDAAAIDGPALERRVSEGLAARAPSAPPPSPQPPKDCSTADRLTAGAVLVGDRLSLRFFEKEGAESAALAGTRPVYFERLDLSGTYDVDARGQISIPLVGRIDADGYALACVEALVSDRYTRAFATEASVSAAFASRPPVVVTGAVRAPGSYTVTPGMVLRHLLALAGAPSTQDGGAARAAEAPLLARKAELENLAAGLRLEVRMLTAAQAHQEQPDLAPDERSLYQAKLGASRLQSELANLAARVETFERDKRDRAAQLQEKRDMLVLLQEQQAVLDRQVGEKRDRLAELRGLTERGLAPLTRLAADEAALITLEHSAFELRSATLAQQAAVRQAEEALEAVDGDYRGAIAADLRDRTKEADAIDAQLASIDLQVGMLSDGSAGAGERVTIVRNGPAGPVRLEGSLASIILPGDLVEVATGDSRVSELQ
ncbi:MAG: polysaccharide biosynthesis/export family protein [Amaricoccus sp.]